MANKVNLDAMIGRRDFDPKRVSTKQGEYDKIFVHDLTSGHSTLSMLRKPDFQRDTNVWSPQQVLDLIRAFVEEDLVPAVILWRSDDNYDYVIDGSHRLSSLIAWINGDYGVGSTFSQRFFAYDVDENEKAAKKVEGDVNREIGKFTDIDKALQIDGALEKHRAICQKLRHLHLKVQWMTGSGEKAEKSFFKINRQGVRLTPGEVTLLELRHYPNSLAARAINQHGGGHRHWKDFSAKHQETTEKMAKELFSCLFEPELKGGTLNTTEVPIAGRANAANAAYLLFDTVNACNDNATPSAKETDGEETVKYLGKTKQVIYRICNRTTKDDSSSLNMHPFVYFYSDSGNHLPASFSAMVLLMKQFEREDAFVKFTVVREHFEEFLLGHKDYISQVHRHARGQVKGVDAIKDYFSFLVNELSSYRGNDPTHHLQTALDKSQFSYLSLPKASHKTSKKKRFPTSVKNTAFITQKLREATKCWVCHARMPDYGMSHDHKQKVAENGPSTIDNHDFAHDYCNSARDAILAAMQLKNGVGA